mgnify:CR=1 FL=1
MKRLIFLLVPLLLIGCTTTNERGEATTDRTSTGAVVGAVTGAIIGHQADHKSGAVVGAILGGAAGAAIGKNMDEQERAYNRTLEQERQSNAIQVERVRQDMLKLTLSNEVTFDVNSAKIRPGFRSSLDKVAEVMNKYPGSNITIVGHTDSTGTEAYNQQLSERRAQSVAYFLESKGVSPDRLRTEGRGEMQPRASNETAEGRQLNRRVEIFVQQHAPAQG